MKQPSSADSVQQGFQPSVAARERVVVGPVPSWAVTADFDANLPAQAGEHCTQLLLSRQTHFELKCNHVHSALRLETMQAVQQISQWRVQFQPETESIMVHWVRIRRGNQLIDYTQLDRFKVLQREEGLDSFVVDGSFTLLLVLEDVRVGDILETCCTIESNTSLMPEAASAFFTLPTEMLVGKFYFAFRCRDSRPLRWKSSSDDVKPIENRENGEATWVWKGERYLAPKLEWNVPDWYSETRWIQFSDLSDWETVSAAVYRAWPHQDEDPIIDKLLQEITGDESDVLLRVEKTIRFIQDEYRYLSINWEVGGKIPASPSRVALRRFGDCKDLAFLMVHLLRRLGIAARPVLVHTGLRGAIKEMLPTPDLFNHVIVEIEFQGQRRWVDAVAKLQGGSALDCVISNFGAGLAVDVANGGLIEPPATPTQLFEVKETLLLDTTGQPSILAVVVTANGLHAERLRHQFANVRREDIEKDRLERCARRFIKARRSGAMEIRDDRATNQFFIAEVFEVDGFLLASSEPGMCVFPFPLNLAFDILLMPDKGERRGPFALNHPCDFIHKIEVESSTFQPVPYKRCHLENKFLRFSRTHKHIYQHWSSTFAFSTRADSVPANRIEEHRQMLTNIETESLLSLSVPIGYAHPRRRREFGALPLPSFQRIQKLESPLITPAAQQESLPIILSAEGPRASVPASSPPTPRAGSQSFHRQNRRRKESVKKNSLIMTIVIALCAVLALVLIIAAVR